MKAIRKVTLCVLSFVVMFMMMTATFDKKMYQRQKQQEYL